MHHRSTCWLTYTFGFTLGVPRAVSAADVEADAGSLFTLITVFAYGLAARGPTTVGNIDVRLEGTVHRFLGR